jgi:predicted glutamine amidotransferase
MCVIAYSPKGIQISKEKLENCWSGNDDGAGIMYSVDGQIIVKKEMKDFEKFYEYYQEALEQDTNVVMHFRISTSGGINELNCHPFRVHKGLWFCHNGMLSVEIPRDSKINDTQIFNEKYLKHLPSDFIKNDSILGLIETAIGSYNKFVFLDSDGNVAIVNEKAGNWNEGSWFSNYSYNTTMYRSNYYRGGYNGYNGHNGYTPPATNTKTANAWDDDDFYGEDEYDFHRSGKFKESGNPFDGRKSITGTGVDINNDGVLWDECGICGDLNMENSLTYTRTYNVYACITCNDWITKEEFEYRKGLPNSSTNHNKSVY